MGGGGVKRGQRGAGVEGARGVQGQDFTMRLMAWKKIRQYGLSSFPQEYDSTVQVRVTVSSGGKKAVVSLQRCGWAWAFPTQTCHSSRREASRKATAGSGAPAGGGGTGALTTAIELRDRRGIPDSLFGVREGGGEKTSGVREGESAGRLLGDGVPLIRIF